ncbi:MAG: HK97 family phage prohead protease [Bacteroidota bacterium]|nr:HK97 family phage prohead protease [Bacteroidota bacterium]
MAQVAIEERKRRDEEIAERPLRQSFDAVIQSVEKNQRTLTCMIVSAQTNRGKRKVEIKGCQYEDYMKSPVVLAFHDEEKVIARCQWLKFTEQGIVAKFEFRDNELANDIYDLYKEGFLTSWSIGFLPVTWNYEEEEGVEIIHITKWILLEVSAVSIPMDANAITLAINQGIVHDQFLIQSICTAKISQQNEELQSSSLKMLSEIELLKKEIAGIITLLKDSTGEILTSFNILKRDLMQSQPSTETKVTNISELTEEIRRSIKSHLEQIKGKL